MTNNMVIREKATPAVQNRSQVLDAELSQYYPAYDEVRTGKLVDEVIAAIKDNRANTKRAISADIASTARVQTQNDRVIAACERELRRRDLSDERRNELFDCISRAAESTAYANADSREFQRQQLDYSHKLPWKIILFIAVLAVSGTALVRATAA